MDIGRNELIRTPPSWDSEQVVSCSEVIKKMMREENLPELDHIYLFLLRESGEINNEETRSLDNREWDKGITYTNKKGELKWIKGAIRDKML